MGKKGDTKNYNEDFENIRKAAETGELSAISSLISALKERDEKKAEEESKSTAKTKAKSKTRSKTESKGTLQNAKSSKQLKKGKAVEKDSDEIKDLEKSYIKLKKQAEDGDPEAMLKIGKAFYYGNGFKKDELLGMKWIEDAAEKGNADALYLKAEHTYIYGKKDDAIRCYYTAVVAGSADAMYKLGFIDWYGMISKPNRERAVMWFKKAFQKGHIKAGIAIGDYYFECGKIKDALTYYCDDLLKNNTQALAKAGSIMIENSQIKEGIECLERAAKDLNTSYGVRAALALGNHYYYGLKIEQDKKKAFEYYLMAAEKDDREARLRVGNMYYSGDAIEQDKVKAFEYLKLVNRGVNTDYNIEALCNLGQLYYDGIGIEQNKKVARSLFKSAATLGSKEAEEKLKNLIFD